MIGRAMKGLVLPIRAKRSSGRRVRSLLYMRAVCKHGPVLDKAAVSAAKPPPRKPREAPVTDNERKALEAWRRARNKRRNQRAARARLATQLVAELARKKSAKQLAKERRAIERERELGRAAMHLGAQGRPRPRPSRGLL